MGNVTVGLPFVPQRQSLRNAETMLLIDHHQTQLLVDHIVLKKCVCADSDPCLAARQLGARRLAITLSHASA